METSSAASADSTPALRRACDATRFPRLARELSTLRAMAAIHCRERHARPGGALCADCRGLLDYAERRLDRCVFGEDKPTCANCTVHCYSAARREQVKAVMRCAGPRMVWRHPVLAIAHIVDGRRPAPLLGQRQPAAAPGPASHRQDR
jgi:hypothetical protein